MSIRDDYYAIINRRGDRTSLIRNRRVTIPSVRCLPDDPGGSKTTKDSRWLESAELSGERLLMTRIDSYRERKKELTAVFVALATRANADIICRVLCPLLRASNNTIFIFGRRVNVSPMRRAILLVLFFAPLLSLG